MYYLKKIADVGLIAHVTFQKTKIETIKNKILKTDRKPIYEY